MYRAVQGACELKIPGRSGAEAAHSTGGGRRVKSLGFKVSVLSHSLLCLDGIYAVEQPAMTVLTELQKISFLMSRYWFNDSQIWTASGRHQLLDLPSLHLFKKKK